MSMTREQILALLPPYQNIRVKQVANQTVNDIMRAMKHTHNEYLEQYQKIAPYFVGSTVYKTAKNIYNFLRNNTRYYQEPDTVQTVQSPAAIVANGLINGIDCKNYALFAGGILDAINYLGLQYIPWTYRYVSDKIYSTTPGHVFVVIYPDTTNEIWIDPIPQISKFNEKWTYYYSIDKKPNNMALYAVSGRQNDAVGFVITPEQGVQIFNALKGLFGGKGSPNDWMGWPEQERKANFQPGTSAQHWILFDGDSVRNEALNIYKWIEKYGLESVLNYNPHFGRTITINDLADKLRRGGFVNEANEFIAQAEKIVIPPNNNPGNNEPTKAGTNILWTLAIAAGAFMLLKKAN